MNLSRDICNIIISKMDIDTRRSLGIYTRLKHPPDVKILLESMIDKIKVSFDRTYVSLGKYEICRFFNNNDMIDSRVHYYPSNANLVIVVSLIEDE